MSGEDRGVQVEARTLSGVRRCEESKRVHERTPGEMCDRRAVGYVVSGPMFVCHNHARHWEAQGEEIARVFR